MPGQNPPGLDPPGPGDMLNDAAMAEAELEQATDEVEAIIHPQDRRKHPPAVQAFGFSRSASLYALANQIQEVEAKVRAADDGLSEDLEQEFDFAHASFEDKARLVAERWWRAEQELAEVMTLLVIVTQRKDRAKRVVDRFSKYLGTQLHRAKRTVDVELGGVPVELTAKETTETVVPKHYYADPRKLPGAVYSRTYVYSIDRREVRKLLDAGTKLPEGVYVKRTYSVGVK